MTPQVFGRRPSQNRRSSLQAGFFERVQLLEQALVQHYLYRFHVDSLSIVRLFANRQAVRYHSAVMDHNGPISPQRAGLFATVAAFVLGALLINGVIFALGWGGDQARVQPWFAPPGAVIGSVWMVLFGLMGAARWLAASAGGPGSAGAARSVLLLAIFCALYPAYTRGLSSLEIALAGSLATLAAAGWVAWRLRPVSRTAAALVAAVVLWVVFATLLVVRTMQLNA